MRRCFPQVPGTPALYSHPVPERHTHIHSKLWLLLPRYLHRYDGRKKEPYPRSLPPALPLRPSHCLQNPHQQNQKLQNQHLMNHLQQCQYCQSRNCYPQPQYPPARFLLQNQLIHPSWHKMQHHSPALPQKRNLPSLIRGSPSAAGSQEAPPHLRQAPQPIYTTGFFYLMSSQYPFLFPDRVILFPSYT